MAYYGSFHSNPSYDAQSYKLTKIHILQERINELRSLLAQKTPLLNN